MNDTEIEKYERINSIIDTIGGLMVVLTIISIIPMIWFFWMWKITASLAVLALLFGLLSASADMELKKRKLIWTRTDLNSSKE